MTAQLALCMTFWMLCVPLHYINSPTSTETNQDIHRALRNAVNKFIYAVDVLADSYFNRNIVGFGSNLTCAICQAYGNAIASSSTPSHKQRYESALARSCTNLHVFESTCNAFMNSISIYLRFYINGTTSTTNNTVCIAIFGMCNTQNQYIDKG